MRGAIYVSLLAVAVGLLVQQTVTAGDWGSKTHAGMSAQRATELLGKDVENPSGKKLGTLSDMAINRSQGQVVYAVLSTGGVMGIGAKDFAVPLNAMRLSADGDALVVNISESQLKDSQGFDKNNWPDRPQSILMHSTSAQSSQQYGFYESDSTRMRDRANVRADADDNAEFSRRYEGGQRYEYDRVNRSDEFDETRDGVYGYGEPRKDKDEARVYQGGQRYDATTEQYPQQGTYQQQGTWSGQSQWSQDGSTSGFTPLYGTAGSAAFVDWSANPDDRWANRVRGIIGSDARDMQNRDLGEIEDLVIDMSSGRIVFAIVDPSAELDLGNRFAAVPWSRVQVDAPGDRVVINANPQSLRQAAFEKTQWPNLADARWSQSVFQAYGEQPSWPTYGYQGYAQPQQQRQFPQQQGWQQQGQMQPQSYQQPSHYEQQSEQWISGRITDKETVQAQSGRDITQITLRDERGQEHAVRVGPSSALPNRLNLDEDQQIRVLGTRMEIDGEQAIVARQIQQAGQTFNLRDMNGRWIFQDQGAPSRRDQSNW